MTNSFQEKFIEKLEEQYGPWEKSTARFGTASYGKISQDLCISPSQFSKLIYGNATEGMYVRSIRNIERLIEEQKNLTEREDALKNLTFEQEKVHKLELQRQRINYKSILYPVLALLIGSVGMYFYSGQLFQDKTLNTSPNQHPLSPYFDKDFNADFDSPYLMESEVQDYCPCSAYEGVWSLNESFKLPLPGSRQPGLYYLAKSSDIRMKCSKIQALNVGKGKVLAGYEYLISEIWVDTKQTPLIPKYFNRDSKTYTREFDELVFEDQPQFKKVATLHAFNVNNFEIHKDSIVRRGELTGRYATDVDDDLTLLYKIDIKHILEDVLGNLTKTDCQPTANEFCDPNDLTEKESVIAFDCLYTIRSENLGIGGGYPYTKSFRLEKQNYSDNLTCRCTDE